MEGNFNKDIGGDKSKIFLLILPLFIIVGLAIFIFGLGNRTLHCTYTGANGYACQTNLKIFAFNLGTDNFTNITEAVLVSSKRSGSTSRTTYQMQFVNQKGQNFTYTNSWTSGYSFINKNVKNLNAKFAENKDFIYELPSEF